MAGPTEQTRPGDIDIETRREKAVQLRRDGKTYREIARALDVSLGQAYADVRAVYDRVRQEANETVEEIRAVELERLDRMIEKLVPDLEHAGRRARCAEVLVKLQERRAKLLGLDAPTNVKHDAGGGLADLLQLAFGGAGPDAAEPVE